MKGVLLATDFVKDVDGTFKILETNTAISIAPKSFSEYFNTQRFKQFVSDNGITEIYFLVGNKGGMVDVIDVYGETGNYYSVIRKAFDLDGVTVMMKATSNSLSPYIVEDAPNRLIIRLSYDQNALIDETYAKDNFEFLKLLNDNDSQNQCATYFDDGVGLSVNTLGNEVRDNGEYPNYIIKSRFPTTDYLSYPKIMKVDTIEQLNLIKSSLQSDELLQEYVLNTNDLLNGKIKTYRTIQLIYGSSLDVYDFMEPYVHTNKSAIDSTVDYDVNGVIQLWERPKFIQKVSNLSVPKNYHTYTYSDIILPNNLIVDIDDVSIGDDVKSVNLYNLDLDNEHLWKNYNVSSADVFSGTTITSSVVVDKRKMIDQVVKVTFTLDDGTQFSYGFDGLVLEEGVDNMISFSGVKDLTVGNRLVLNRISNDEFVIKTITNIDYGFVVVDRLFFDVEESDLYLKVDDSVSPQYYMINHNREDAGGCSCYGGFDIWCPAPCISSWECEGNDGVCCNQSPEGFGWYEMGPELCNPSKE